MTTKSLWHISVPTFEIISVNLAYLIVLWILQFYLGSCTSCVFNTTQVFSAQHLLFAKRCNNMDTWLETLKANMSIHNYNPC